MNPEVEAYISRSERWPEEMSRLRPILLDSGLTEEIKWRKPCYTHDGANVAIVQEMNDFLALMFFKGALLEDPDDVLEEQGPNSRSARRIELRSVEDVERLAGTIASYLTEAIDVEEAGLEVDPPPELEPVAELRERMEREPEFKEAFEALTPGRQREYNLFFSDAKRPETRMARIDRCAPKILARRGLRDR
jgi:uncharacterized protein YdeI (YjbR/CyaY-like superfamily)